MVVDMASNSSERENTREEIKWEERDQTAVSGVTPSPKYGILGESLRQTFPEKKSCSLFCGGKKCKYCNPVESGAWSSDQMVIEGLFSNWVTDNILAISRPTTMAIEKYNIIEQFHSHGIRSLINLQLPGEHASCGPTSLALSGFSYDPQLFMDNDIFFYNFGWQDYNVGSIGAIVDMVKVMQFALSEGKVAVHCHAGLGRTGVLIACYLVFANHMTANDAIHYIRSKRNGAVQTSGQIECIQRFSDWIKPVRIVFSSVVEDAFDFTLTQFLHKQAHLLHGFEARELKYIPKIVQKCCDRLLHLADRGVDNAFKLDMAAAAELAAAGCSKEKPDTIRLNGSFTALDLPRRSTSMAATAGMKWLPAETLEAEFGAESDTTRVAEALARTEYTESQCETVREYKIAMNEGEAVWGRLAEETDACVVSLLMCDWMDELKEPILHAQDLPHMLGYVQKPIEGLDQLDKGTRSTVLRLVGTLARLMPLPKRHLVAALQRLLSTLTQQNMAGEPLSADVSRMTGGNVSILKRTASNNSGLMRDDVASLMLDFFMQLVHLMATRIQMDEDPTGLSSVFGRNASKAIGASVKAGHQSPTEKTVGKSDMSSSTAMKQKHTDRTVKKSDVSGKLSMEKMKQIDVKSKQTDGKTKQTDERAKQK